MCACVCFPLSTDCQILQDIANAKLAPTHPINLRLALNFLVFYYEILNSRDKACGLAKLVLILNIQIIYLFILFLFFEDKFARKKYESKKKKTKNKNKKKTIE